ncbi:MAG: hypothetical protein MAG453_01980 [Calditrichaeota bacterium]|nr:hypothetical protein [Calditrichota bacterium]
MIAGRVLKLANSAFYGGGRRTLDSIPLAVNRLGFRTVRTLVYSSALPDLFTNAPHLDHYQFWRHSLTVAMLARDLMTRSPERTLKSVDQAYLSGLLHGVGLLVFQTLFPKEYGSALEEARDTARSLSDVEVEMFGIDHQELGAILLESEWDMDAVIVDAVKNHVRAPDGQGTRSVNETLFVANSVCLVYGISNGTGLSYTHQHLELLSSLGRLGYDQHSIERLLDLAKSEVSTIEELLNTE